jgi:hypothetical protein
MNRPRRKIKQKAARRAPYYQLVLWRGLVMRKSHSFRIFLAVSLIYGALASAEARAQCPLGGCPPGSSTPPKAPPKPKPQPPAKKPPVAVKPPTKQTTFKPAPPPETAAAPTDVPLAKPVEKPSPGKNGAAANGTLTVMADPKATVTLARDGKPLETPGARAEQFIVFSNLARGSYTVVAELDGVKTDPLAVELQAGEARTVDARLAGALLVVTQPQAKVTVTAQGKVVREGTANETGSLSVTDLPNGSYQVAAQLEGYKAASQEVKVVAQNTAPVTLRLAPVTYNVTLAFNAASGRVMLQNSAETVKWDTYKFQNASVPLSDLPAGSYRLQVEPDDASFQPKSLTLTVPSADGAVKIMLDKRLSAEAFTPQEADDWRFFGAPWEAKEGKVSLNGAGLAFARQDKFRYYGDFVLQTQARLLNGESFSFIVRAADEKNYYRIELNGPKSAKSGLCGYTVRDGAEKPFTSRCVTLIPHFPVLGGGKPFYVTLTMTGQRIEVSIKEDLKDTSGVAPMLRADGDFNVGAVGVSTNNTGKAEIKSFRVQPAGQ